MTRWQVLFSLFLVVATTVVAAPAAQAMSCREAPDPVKAWAAELASADVVFQGRALSIDQELATTFAVERVFKGVVGPRVVVATYRNKYIRIEPPGRFVVFGYLDGGSDGPRALSIRGCMTTLGVPWPAALDPILGKGRPPAATGTIVASGNPGVADITDAAASPTSTAPSDAAPASTAPSDTAPSSVAQPDAEAAAVEPSTHTPHRGGCASCAVATGDDVPALPGVLFCISAVVAAWRRCFEGP